MRMLLIIFICVVAIAQLNAQTAQDKWNKTDYNFVRLFTEKNFNSRSCNKSEKEFIACLSALNYLAHNLKKPSQVVIKPHMQFKNRISLIRASANGYSLEQRKTFISNAKNLYSIHKSIEISYLFRTLYRRASILQKDIAYIAAQTYSIYLQKAYDPYSTLLTSTELQPSVQKYFGIGATVHKVATTKDIQTVPMFVDPMPGSPALKAGLVKGDLILKVDGVDITRKDLNSSVELIKGAKDSRVILTVKRLCTDEIEEIEVIRGPIEFRADISKDSYFVDFNPNIISPKAIQCALKNKVSKIKEDENDAEAAPKYQVMYIPLKMFNGTRSGEVSLCKKFVALLQKSQDNKNSIGTILDLRNNAGGDLAQTLCMLDSLISSKSLLFQYNKVVRGVYKENAPKEQVFFTTKPRLANREHYTKPIIILINSLSASASEIFAGTIQDMQRGWVVGDLSFGKGTVQSIRPYLFSRPKLFRAKRGVDVYIKQTIAIYSLNSGRSPQRVGITPDFRFSPLGKVITKDDANTKNISAQKNIIKGFKNKSWVQSRPSEVDKILSCVQSPGTLSSNFMLNLKAQTDNTYSGRFLNYQDFMARDILKCILYN